MKSFSIAAALLFIGAGAQDDIEECRKELKDTSYGNLWDRRDAARDLGRTGTREAAAVLLQFAGKSDPATREAIVLGIARLNDDTVRNWVLDTLPRLKDENTRADVVWAFRRMKWDGARDVIHKMLRDSSWKVRAGAARTLGVLEDNRCAEAVEDGKPEVVEQALLASAKLKAEVPKKKLQKILKRGAPRVQAAALRYLAATDPESLNAEMEPFLRRSAKVECRITIADVAVSIDPLKTLINDKDWRVRVASVAGMERIWTPEAVDALVARMQKEDGRLRLDIAQSLERMTGRAIGYEAKHWKSWWKANKDSFKMPEKPKPGANRVVGKPKTRASFYDIPILSKRVVFLIDASGSMKYEDEIYKGKRKIDVALEELEKAVRGLDRDARFNVIMLSTEATRQKVRSLSPRLVGASPANRKKAVDLVKKSWKKLEKIRRGRGDIYDAIMEALADEDVDTVVLLSDGKATDGTYLDRKHLVEAIGIEYRYRRAAVHTILTGSRGIDEKMMEGIAEVTGGIYMPRK